MKRLFNIPRITTVSLALMLTAGVVIVSEVACNSQKPGCGTKRQHKARKKQVRRMAPSMGG